MDKGLQFREESYSRNIERSYRMDFLLMTDYIRLTFLLLCERFPNLQQHTSVLTTIKGLNVTTWSNQLIYVMSNCLQTSFDRKALILNIEDYSFDPLETRDVDAKLNAVICSWPIYYYKYRGNISWIFADNYEVTFLIHTKIVNFFSHI